MRTARKSRRFNNSRAFTVAIDAILTPESDLKPLRQLQHRNTSTRVVLR